MTGSAPPRNSDHDVLLASELYERYVELARLAESELLRPEASEASQPAGPPPNGLEIDTTPIGLAVNC